MNEIKINEWVKVPATREHDGLDLFGRVIRIDIGRIVIEDSRGAS